MSPAASKTLVFVFCGEFGYELFNWQGVVRKLSSRLDPAVRIVACSRAGMAPFYESVDAYVDISQLDTYRTSIAAGYTVLGVDVQELRREVTAYLPKKIPWLRDSAVDYVFSFEPRRIEGLLFGDGGIYANLDLQNNSFVRIEPDLSQRSAIEGELGFGLDEPYVLCQTARREIVVRSADRVPVAPLLERLASRIRTVLLDFDTGRALDSYSSFGSLPNCRTIRAATFGRQGCLIHFAKKCLFFSEGDFRSHLYVPPFLGRDVLVVAPASVYGVTGYGGVSTTPIEFWNETVFRFGGRLRVSTSENVFRSEQTLAAFLDSVLT